MQLRILLLPVRDHQFLAASLAALANQTAPSHAYSVCVLGARGSWLPTDPKLGPSVTFSSPPTITAQDVIGDAEHLLVLRSDVALFPDAVARHLAAGSGQTGVRLVRIRQTPTDVESGFHQYVEWECGRPLPLAEAWPRCRWFDGLVIARDQWLTCEAPLANTAPAVVTLLDIECRLRRIRATVDAPDGWSGHLVEPVTFDSWCAEAEVLGRHAWSLFEALPESAIATDLGVSTALVAAAEEDAEAAGAQRPFDTATVDGEDPFADPLFQWRELMERWHAGLKLAVANGLRQSTRPAAMFPLVDRTAMMAGVDMRPRTHVVGRGALVEADSRIQSIEVKGTAAHQLLRAPSGGYHAYFVVQNVPRRSRELDVVVEYLDRGHCVWALDYDSTDRDVNHPSEPPGAFKRAFGVVSHENSGEWRTARFSIADWRFHRRCHGADLRVIAIENGDDGLVIGKISLEITSTGLIAARRLAGDLAAAVRVPETLEPDVSIIIPTHNGVDYTRQCLHGLLRTVGVPYEVIVVDNDSTDDTRLYVSTCPGVRLVRRNRNDSFAASCNAGARLARSPLLVFLNNDTVPLPGWLLALTSPLTTGRAGITGARLLFPDDWSIQHAGIDWIQGQPSHAFSHRDCCSLDAATPRDVFGVTGACLAIRRSLFWDVSGFDERYVFGYEDLDLCMKVREMGLATFYCPASTLLHYQGASGRDLGTDASNRARFVRRWAALIAACEPH
jgi:GT2 family glycosyltransferase